MSGFHHQVGSPPASRSGSKFHTCPRSSRSRRVAQCRSGLLEVANAAPGAESSVGIARALVLPRRGPQMSHCMSSQVAYSGWPLLTARATGRPSCWTPKRLAVARALARDTGCTSRPRPITCAARSACVRRDLPRTSEITTTTAIRSSRPPPIARSDVAAGGQPVLPSASSSTSARGSTGGGWRQWSMLAPSCTAASAAAAATTTIPIVPASSGEKPLEPVEWRWAGLLTAARALGVQALWAGVRLVGCSRARACWCR